MITREQKEYLLPKAYNAAIRAGAAILDIYNSGGPIDVDIKSDRSPITVADRLAHSVIREYLGQTRIPLLSEEGREMLYAERKDWDLFWMVDPLDGTVEFIKGNGEFTVNIALMADNRPVFGVIYVPYRKRIYFSDSDLGAFRSCNTEADPEAEYVYAEITAGAEALPLTDCRNRPLKVAVSRSHSDGETARHLEELRKRHPDAEVLQQGSSYKLCLIAEGSVDYYPRTTETYEWDTAAGESIIALAGGSIYSLDDTAPLRYNKESLVNPRFACSPSASGPHRQLPVRRLPFPFGRTASAIAAARNIARRGVQSVEFARLLNNAFDTPRTHVLVLAYLRLDIMSLEYQRQRHSHHEKSDQPDRYQYDYKCI